MSDKPQSPAEAHGSKREVVDGDFLWLWKNGDHYLAFRHEYPCFEPGGDPMTLGQPFGRAIFTRSYDRASRAPAARSNVQPKHTACEYCDGTGDVHSLDGEWRGECNMCPAAALHAFKNFHRLLCERFGYGHDEKDWRRDQLSLIEFIAAKVQAPAPAHEPVAWIEHDWSGTGCRRLHFERRPETVRDEVVNPIWTPLYAAPCAAVGADDAKDAARYRWLRHAWVEAEIDDDKGSPWEPVMHCMTTAEMDAAIDAAISDVPVQPMGGSDV